MLQPLCILILFVFAPICPLGFCRGRESLQNLCEQIPGDALLYSMFKENAEPVRCPLKGTLSHLHCNWQLRYINPTFHTFYQCIMVNYLKKRPAAQVFLLIFNVISYSDDQYQHLFVSMNSIFTFFAIMVV